MERDILKKAIGIFSGHRNEICFIHDQRATFPVRVMCKMLDVSASGYYA